MDPLSDVIFSKDGVIRVECASCALNYTVLNNSYAVNVNNSEDVKFNYVSDFELKTNLSSNEKQNIRLAVFDAYGRIIYNEVASLDKGEHRIDTFTIKLN